MLYGHLITRTGKVVHGCGHQVWLRSWRMSYVSREEERDYAPALPRVYCYTPLINVGHEHLVITG